MSVEVEPICWEPPSDFVMIRDGVAKPIFLLNPLEPQKVRPFVDELVEIPVYGVLDEGVPREIRTIEGLSTHLVRSIRAIQPRGPYRLLSTYQSAVVAYEVAMQLIGADEDVAFLAAVPLDGAKDLACIDGIQDYVVHPLPVVFRVVAETAVKLPALAGAVIEVVQGPRMGIEASECRSILGRLIYCELQHAAEENRVSTNTSELLVTIQTGDPSRTPVFFVPGAGDIATQFVHVAAELSIASPVYGFQHRGIDGASVPHASVEAMARAYVTRILQDHHDAVHLVGHSFGGWAAFEVARQLAARGRKVSSLMIIDSDVPDRPGDSIREHNQTEVLMQWISAIELASSRDLGVTSEMLESCAESARLALIHERMVAANIMSRRSGWETLVGPLRTFASAIRTNYCAGVSAARNIFLLLVDDPRLDQRANEDLCNGIRAGWKRLAPNLTHCKAPGNHFTVLKPPNARWIADYWRSVARER